jgi:hypothetical protein
MELQKRFDQKLKAKYPRRRPRSSWKKQARADVTENESLP